MDLSKRIRTLRQRDGLSQEALAGHIYVTRQTVSNWETERSYPDVQSLLLLSALFDVSLDELVKGDIAMMKNELDAYKLDIWSYVMVICLVVGAVGAFPMCTAFGLIGFIPSIILFIIAFAATEIVERLKKKHMLTTYAEIVAFSEGTPVDVEKDKRERKLGALRVALLKSGGGAIAGLLLSAIGLLVSQLLFGSF